MLNKVHIIGRLGQNPEVKYTSDGKVVCTFSVATSEYYTDKNGQKKETTEWHNIVCFDRTAENCGKFISKGSLVHVEGRLKTDKWQDKNGNDRYTTKINAQLVQFLDRKSDIQGQEEYSVNNSHAHKTLPTSTSEMDDFSFESSSMDDFPF